MSRRLWQKLMVGMGLLVLLMLLTTVIPTAPAAAPEKPMTLV
jgi:hypothetical protein